MIDFRATLPHYVDHLAPIWHALPEDQRGVFWGSPDSTHRLEHHGIEHQLGYDRSDRTLVVAAYRDQKRAKAGRKVLVEHGIGQSYSDLKADYTGGVDRHHFAAILSPNLNVTQQAPPGVHAPICGTAKMDYWFTCDYPQLELHLRPVVVVSFHWDCDLHPETMSAWAEYCDALPALAEGPWDLVVHSHPRAARDVAPWCARRRIPYVHNFDWVLEHADLYAVDNSSTLYEFAATGRPVVVVNPDIYRRDVEHGLRFWELSDVGLNVDRPEDFRDVVCDALVDSSDLAKRRREIGSMLYPHQDGSATRRCVESLLELDNDANL